MEILVEGEEKSEEEIEEETEGQKRCEYAALAFARRGCVFVLCKGGGGG